MVALFADPFEHILSKPRPAESVQSARLSCRHIVNNGGFAGTVWLNLCVNQFRLNHLEFWCRNANL